MKPPKSASPAPSPTPSAGAGFSSSRKTQGHGCNPSNRISPAGKFVSAVGLPDTVEGRIILRDAVVQSTGGSDPVTPAKIGAGAARSGSQHAKLVSIEARLVDALTESPGLRVLVCEADGIRFRSELRSPGSPEFPEKGSLVKLVGICVNEPPVLLESAGEELNFRILLRAPADITLLAKPPWWTPVRIWTLIGSLALILIAITVWNLLLQRTVENQTNVIQQKLEHEVVWEERNRIARELHDTLEQHLTGITMQIDTLAANPTASPLRRSLAKVKAMLNHSRAEAKNSIWDLRSHTLELLGLVPALEEIARNFDTGENQPVTVETKGEPRRLARQTEFHLMRIAQEAATNALKHGKATVITLTLDYTGETAAMHVANDGIPFAGESDDSSTVHFGILGMKERAAKIRARIEIHSEPESGTRISVLDIPDRTATSKLHEKQ